jgi:arginine-tRNA-protein transferase
VTEVTPQVVSLIYHFHDPAQAERGLGTFVILHAFELARRLAKPWVYLGYFVQGCGSMEYKARFGPCELLEPDGTWRPFAPP